MPGQLMFRQHLARALDYRHGQAREFRDLNAVAAVGGPGLHLAQEGDASAGLLHRDVKILDPRKLLGQLGQFEIMSGEQRLGAHLVMQIFHRRPGDREPIVSGGAAANLIKDHETALGSVVQDIRCLTHLDHEGGLASRQIIAGA